MRRAQSIVNTFMVIGLYLIVVSTIYFTLALPRSLSDGLVICREQHHTLS